MKTKLLLFLFILCFPFTAEARYINKTENTYKDNYMGFADSSSCRVEKNQAYSHCEKRCGENSWKCLVQCTFVETDKYMKCVFDKQDNEEYYPY